MGPFSLSSRWFRVGSAFVRREAIFHFRPERVSQGCGMYAYGLVHVYIKCKSPNFETYGILAISLVPRWFRVRSARCYFDKFGELKKNIVYHFDAEKAHLSIGEVFRAIPALLPPVFESFQHPIPYSEERKLPL